MTYEPGNPIPLPSVMLAGTPPPMEVKGPFVVITIRKMLNQPIVFRLRPVCSSFGPVDESGMASSLKFGQEWRFAQASAKAPIPYMSAAITQASPRLRQAVSERNLIVSPGLPSPGGDVHS